MTIKQWCKTNKMPLYVLATKLNISRKRMYTLANGREAPSFSLMLAIIDVSDGDISADDIIAPFLTGAHSGNETAGAAVDNESAAPKE